MNLWAINRSVLAAGRENSPFLLFSYSKDIVGRVRSKSLGVEREWRNLPPLDRLSTRDRRDTKETKAIIPPAEGSDKVPVENRDQTPFRYYFFGQLVNRLRHPPRTGPLVFVLFA